MKAPVLVATPHAPFGELLRISLEDSGQYTVRLAHSAKEAREAAAGSSFHLAILDSALVDAPFVTLFTDLLQAQPGLRLMVIPPENNPNHPTLGGLMPHGYLSRPFYLPDLIQTAARLIEEREKAFRGGPAAAAPSDTLPPWLQEPMTLTMYLEKELAGTQALAGIVGLAGEPDEHGGRLRASAGIFARPAAEELAAVVFRYWNAADKTDLMRYIRMESDKREYLVYATQITGSLVLILVYDTAAPLSQIRPRTREVAHTLASVPPDDIRGARPALPAARMPAAGMPAAGTPTAAFDAETLPYSIEDRLNEEQSIETPMVNLAALLGSIPPPDPTASGALPQAAELGGGWERESAPVPGGAAGTARAQAGGAPTIGGAVEAVEKPVAGAPAAPAGGAAEQEPAPALFPTAPRAGIEMLAAMPVTAPPPLETQPGERQAGAAAEPIIVPDALPGEPPAHRLGDTAPVSVQPHRLDHDTPKPAAVGIEEPPVDPLEDTRPGAIASMQQSGLFEPVSPALSLLNYTCVLMPRSPQHYLIGELADRLALWVAQICMAFGWRLEGIAVRPEYLQWSVKVAPAVSPGNLVRILRQRTSLNIFTTFETLAVPPAAGDFWAPGYLIVSGQQPPSAQLLRDYIHQTRSRMRR